MSYRCQERGLNWTTEEKYYLIENIEKRKHVIENKHSDLPSISNRNMAWTEIANLQNAAFPPPRETQKIKEQYQRLKSHAKKEFSEFRRLSLFTDSPCPPSEISQRISAIAPNDFIDNITSTNCCSSKGGLNSEINSNSSRVSSASTQQGTDCSTGVKIEECPEKAQQHMLVTPKIEPSDTDGEDCQSAETFIISGTAAEADSGRSSVKAEKNDGLNLKSSVTSNYGNFDNYAGLPSRTGRRGSSARNRVPYTPLKRKGRATTLSKQAPLSSRSHKFPDMDELHRIRKTMDTVNGWPSFMEESILAFYKEEHDVKIRQMNDEHMMRMEILTLKKHLLEKKIAAHDSKISRMSDGNLHTTVELG